MKKPAMDSQKFTALAELVKQLKFVPGPKLLEQSYNAESFLSQIDPSKKYPADLVWFRITGYRPTGIKLSQQMISAKTLVGDLVEFIEQVAGQLPVPPEELPGDYILASEVCQQLSVCGKTLRRWRLLGLPQRRVILDGQRRAVILTDTLDHFARLHARLIKRSSAFRRLDNASRGNIVKQARNLLADQCLSLHAAAKTISQQTRRPIETIKYILRQHDRLDPDGALFRPRTPISGQQQHEIFQEYTNGTPVEKLASRFHRTAASIYRIVNQTRARWWLEHPVQYVYSAEFELPDADHRILGSDQIGQGAVAKLLLQEDNDKSAGTGRLTAQQERQLFRKYNYLKFKLARRQMLVTARAVRSKILDELDDLGEQVQQTKDKLVLANLALVVSIVKRHLGCGMSFQELVSEGNMAMIRSVEKFDYSRGYKFSTYGSWAIMKGFARAIPAEGRHHQRYIRVSDKQLDLLDKPCAPDELAQDNSYRRTQAVQQAISKLDQREQTILAKRFGLKENDEPMSLSQLGSMFNLSKERIRQIELQAKNKLQKLLTSQGSDLQ